MKVQVWICANGHYYASSSAHDVDLAAVPQRPKVENHSKEEYALRTHAEREAKLIEERGSRATCQRCRDKGLDIDRVMVEVDVPLPAPVAA